MLSETWRECVKRYSRGYGLGDECVEAFDRYVTAGMSEDQAAFDALYDWDCTGYDANTGKLVVRRNE